MVQVFADPAVSPNGAPVHDTVEGWRSNNKKQEADTMMSRDEHAQTMRDLNKKRAMMRTPRRGWSMTEGDAAPTHHFHAAAPQFDRQVSIPENAILPSSAIVTPAGPSPSLGESIKEHVQIPRRPKMPPPRRSHSVTDKEPIPAGQPQVSARMTLLDLPSELHYSLFDILDPIDGVCLGLAHSRLYAIHKRKSGTVPLSSRYSGPNDMEWAWRGAGPLVNRPPTNTTGAVSPAPAAAQPAAHPRKDYHLGELRVKGQVYCRKCGVSRCELHRHLRDWMGDGYEYCEIKEVYGKQAGDDAKPYCFMPSPKNPHRCGRHGSRQLQEK